MKSIRLKILINMTAVILVALMITGIMSVVLSNQSTFDTLELSMQQTVQLAAQRVSTELKGYREVMEQVSQNPIISGVSSATVVAEGGQEAQEPAQGGRIFSKADKVAEFRKAEGRHGFQIVDSTDDTGFSLERYTYVRESDYFKHCRDEGKSYLTAPAINAVTGAMAVTVAAPLKVDNTFNGIVFGVLDANFLSTITDQIKIGEKGTAFILDKAGNVIASPNRDEVLNRYNAIKQAEDSSELAQKAGVHQRMVEGEAAIGEYRENNKKVLVAFAPIPDTQGWSIGIVVDESEFLSATVTSSVATILLVLAATAVAIFIALRLAGGISAPIITSVDRLKLLAEGDLKTPVTVLQTKDETAVLSRAMSQMVDSLNAIIGDITENLGELAKGNFAAASHLEYTGDFVPIKRALDEISQSLNDVMEQINQSADQVASGAEQVSGGSQALSQGATEQASSIQELSASIAMISEEVKGNATHAASASKLSDDAAQQVDQGNAQMEQMVKAMNKISDTSATIGKIVKTIDDIAFQTNILALNAAVEAARVGSAGKGFAVVADEVRNLANKSAEAAQNTSALIEDSMHAVNNGTKLAHDTAQSLQAIVRGAQEVSRLIADISRASGEQAVSINQITQGVDQISAVVQTNSATAEQSAAASQELSGQAQMLKELVGRFRLKSQAGDSMLNWEPQPIKTVEAIEPILHDQPADTVHRRDKY